MNDDWFGVQKDAVREEFSDSDYRQMKSLLDNPYVRAEDKSKMLYSLSAADELSEEEIRTYAAKVPGVDAEDCIDGGEDPVANAKNTAKALTNIADRAESQKSLAVASDALEQGGYSTSDEIVEEGKVGLALFEQFHPRYLDAQQYVAAGAGQSAPPGGQSAPPGGQSAAEAAESAGRTAQPAGGATQPAGGAAQPAGGAGQYGGGAQQPGGGVADTGGGAASGGGRGYTHTGIDPQSLREGMEEFCGINFKAFREDAQKLTEAHSAVEDATDEIDSAWGKAANDWTGQAKDAAEQRKSTLNEGSGDLEQVLNTAPDNIIVTVDDNIKEAVVNFCKAVLNKYQEGTIGGRTVEEIDNDIAKMTELPVMIEMCNGKLEAAKENVILGGFEESFRMQIEQYQNELNNARERLADFCQMYNEEAQAVHRQAGEYVQQIDGSYQDLISVLNEGMDPPPFEETAESKEESGDDVPEQSGVGQVPGGAGPGSGMGGGPPGGGGTPPAGGRMDTAEMGADPDVPGDSEESDTNPVTEEPLETDPETGEPYPIDPRTGEPIKDADSDAETVTVSHGDNELRMRAPDSDGEMVISLDDGSGEPHEFQLDFQPDESSGDVTDADIATEADQPDRGREEGPADDEEDTDRATGSDAETSVYRPGDDGRIHIEKDDVEIVAAQPEGPEGPTVVQVDDGSGEPTTYTLGEPDEDSGAGTEDEGSSRAVSGMRGNASGGVVDSDDVSAADDRSDDSAADDDRERVADDAGNPGTSGIGQESAEAQAAQQPGDSAPGGAAASMVASDSADSAAFADAADVGAGGADTVGGTTVSAGGSVDTADVEDSVSANASGEAEGPNTATSAQGWFGDMVGGDSALGEFFTDGASESDDAVTDDASDDRTGSAGLGAAPHSEVVDDDVSGGAELGESPGSADNSDVTADSDRDGSGWGPGMTGIGGVGSGEDDAESRPPQFGLIEELFADSSERSSRISGSLDDLFGEYQWT